MVDELGNQGWSQDCCFGRRGVGGYTQHTKLSFLWGLGEVMEGTCHHTKVRPLK